MINLSYEFIQDSCSLELSGMPDVSNGDSEQTIGILSSWTLKIIGCPLLEGEKEHLDNLMHVILQYSRSYISGILNSYNSSKNIVKISPQGLKHRLQLNSTKEGIKPLVILLDDSELSDLTRCLDLLRFDSRFNIKWDVATEKPFSKRYILDNLNKSRKNLSILYSFLIFIIISSLLLLIPINKQREINEIKNSPETLIEEIN